MKISKKVTKRLDKIEEEYKNQDNVMSEVLATESADGLTIEEACELYMRAMNIANGDRFYTVLGDDPGYFVNCFDEDDVIEDWS